MKSLTLHEGHFVNMAFNLFISDWNFPELWNFVCLEKVGVKVIDKTKLDDKTTKMLLREIKVMDACHHQNLVRLYEVLETKVWIMKGLSN